MSTQWCPPNKDQPVMTGNAHIGHRVPNSGHAVTTQVHPSPTPNSLPQMTHKPQSKRISKGHKQVVHWGYSLHMLSQVMALVASRRQTIPPTHYQRTYHTLTPCPRSTRTNVGVWGLACTKEYIDNGLMFGHKPSSKQQQLTVLACGLRCRTSSSTPRALDTTCPYQISWVCGLVTKRTLYNCGQ